MYNFNKKREKIMYRNLDVLAHNLNLTNYQFSKLKTHYDRYDIGGLQKRGGILYAPYFSRGLWQRFKCFLFGVPADLIGTDKTLLQAQRKIRFYANGYHCVRVGRYVYYADACGNVISRDEFQKNR